MDIKDIRVGDKIICKDGWQTKVYRVLPTNKEIIVRAFEGELRFIKAEHLRKGEQILVQVK